MAAFGLGGLTALFVATMSVASTNANDYIIVSAADPYHDNLVLVDVQGQYVIDTAILKYEPPLPQHVSFRGLALVCIIHINNFVYYLGALCVLF